MYDIAFFHLIRYICRSLLSFKSKVIFTSIFYKNMFFINIVEEVVQNELYAAECYFSVM